MAWRRSTTTRYRPMAEINVTPFVDVMLVLLIIFMVAAPLLVVGVPIDLPRSQARPLPEDQQPLSVSIDKSGAIFLQDTAVQPRELVARLQAIAENNRDVRIYVRGDRAIAYGQIMEVMGLLNAAGFSKVALVTELPRRRR
ncbi:MAG: protein TolR [Sphingomonadales bacterium]